MNKEENYPWLYSTTIAPLTKNDLIYREVCNHKPIGTNFYTLVTEAVGQSVERTVSTKITYLPVKHNLYLEITQYGWN